MCVFCESLLVLFLLVIHFEKPRIPIISAARVRGAMDTTANPCDDFYQFACGTWVRENVIPEDKSSYGTFTKLRDNVDVIVKSKY